MRLPDWKARLNGYLAQAASLPYVMGRHDCALFAASAIEAVRGTDPAAGYRGRYTTKAGGLRRVRAAGHSSHVEAASTGLDEIAPAFAAPGDLAVVTEAGAEALGVVQGEMVYVLREDGLGLLPRSAMTRAFRT